MKKFFQSFFKNYDWLMVGAVLFLCIIGLAVLFSTTYEVNVKSEAVKQVFNIAIGLVGLVALSRIDYRVLKSYSGVLYVVVIILLVSVQFLGKTVNNAQRWIDFGFFQFQPSLLAQFLMAIILAKYFAENYEELQHLKKVIKSAVYVGIPTILVAMQPNLGTALVFVFTWAVMLIFSNAKRIYLLAAGAIGFASMPVIWTLLKDYQKERVMTFLNPAADPMGSGWNVSQAMIAIGSGQLWGRGLGRGTQSQLDFIPYKHTDFIFASLGEELGFIGIIVTLALLALIFVRGIRTAILARDFFGTYLVIGILSILFIHVFVNVGMNMGLMPVTGIPLPFVSYGGTPILVDLAAIGILLSIHRRYKKIDF